MRMYILFAFIYIKKHRKEYKTAGKNVKTGCQKHTVFIVFIFYFFLKHTNVLPIQKINFNIKNKKNSSSPLQNRSLRIYYRLVKRQISKQINAAGYSKFLTDILLP